MSRRALWIVVAVAVVVLAAWWVRGGDSTSHGEDARSAAHRTVDNTAYQAFRRALGHVPRTSTIPHADVGDGVTISGAVIDARDGKTVANVEVVFRSALGESSVTTNLDGAYSIHLAAGVYRAFVRDDSVLSVGRPDLQRLPGMPSADAAGMPDEGLMPLVVANANVTGLDLSVLRGGEIRGEVVDRSGNPIAGAVVRARSNAWRPALGSDIAETDANGRFSMRVPAGVYLLEASHPRFAGLEGEPTGSRTYVQANNIAAKHLVLTAGCVITGKVVAHDGTPASDGAIEKQWGTTDLQFGPAGRIESDGRFRWVTTDAGDVVLRAWPWKSPPSPSRRFACTDGARFETTFTLPDRGPDIEGVLVDASGAPVPFGHIDLAPLDGGIAQQERTDGNGRWGVFSMPAGRYRVTAHAEGHGIVDTIIHSPQTNVKLALGGTGRLEGTTTRLANGSFEMSLDACTGENGSVRIAHEQRLVTVTAGRFVVDDLPACDLSFTAQWRGHPLTASASIPADCTAQASLDLGPPHEKTIHGIVRDSADRAIPNAVVSATFGEEPPVTAHTDGTGRYSLKTYSGAAIGPSFGVGFGISGSVGTGAAVTLRLGHVMTPTWVLQLELVGASQLHQAAMEGATLHNDDLRLLVGAKYYAQPSLWVRFGGGYGSYHEVFGGDKGDRTLRGVAGLFGFGLDLARFGHWVVGSEFFTSGTITKDGLMTSSALCLGLSRY